MRSWDRATVGMMWLPAAAGDRQSHHHGLFVISQNGTTLDFDTQHTQNSDTMAADPLPISAVSY